MSVIDDNDFYTIVCPHCNKHFIVKKTELNCRIFRCGVLKSNMKQIGPHTKKIECDRLKENNLIYGCSKPFKFITNNGINSIIICDYI